MKKYNRLKAVLFLFLLFQSGGLMASGGIVRNGEVLSIGSSGVRLSLAPLGHQDLPELALALKGLDQMTLPNSVKGPIQMGLRPSSMRSFFRVNQISPQEEQALVEEYRKLIPDLTDKERFTLLAVTDAEKQETYLLPNYFKLSIPSQKAAVLFDEALQVSKLISARRPLLELEALMEVALNCKDSCEASWDDLQIKFATNLEPSLSRGLFLVMLSETAKSDGIKGHLKGILASNGDINYSHFLGQEHFSILKAQWRPPERTVIHSLSPADREPRLVELLHDWPESRFLKVLANCPYNLNFSRFWMDTRVLMAKDNAAPKEPGTTGIYNWQLFELQVHLSRPTIQNYFQLKDYFLNHSLDELADVKSLQPVDIARPTNARKVYVERGPVETITYTCGDYDQYTCKKWRAPYYYYLFAFFLN